MIASCDIWSCAFIVRYCYLKVQHASLSICVIIGLFYKDEEPGPLNTEEQRKKEEYIDACHNLEKKIEGKCATLSNSR